MMVKTSPCILLLIVSHLQTATAIRLWENSCNTETLELQYGARFNVTQWQSAWDAMKNFQKLSNKSGDENLCIDGHLAPEFYLLGAMKSGTTSLSAMLAHQNLVYPYLLPGEPPFLLKEPHIFDIPYRVNKGFWLAHYPKCTTKKRMIATDMSPDYLEIPDVPKRMQQFYGENVHRIKFATILRNPVGRLQSLFHFMQFQGWCEQKYISHGFKDYVTRILDDEFDPCRLVEKSKYHKQLENFMSVFNGSQFLTIPMLEALHPKDGISRANVAVMKSFGLDVKPVSTVHINGRPHNSLVGDLGNETLKKFQSYVDERVNAKKVAQVHIDYNIKVLGYDGPKTPDALADYLESRW